MELLYLDIIILAVFTIFSVYIHNKLPDNTIRTISSVLFVVCLMIIIVETLGSFMLL